MFLKFFSTLVGLSAIALVHAQGDAKAVAMVNGQAISSTAYFHRMEHLNGVYAAYGERLVEVAPGLITLDRLITEQVTIQLAKDHNVSPTQAEIDKAYQARLVANPMFEKDAVDGGLTVDDLKYQVLLDLCRFKLLTEGIIVADSEVQQNYNLHKERYAAAKVVDVRVIVVDTDDQKAAVDADLAAGKEFAAVASARSTDLSKIRGGLIQGTLFDSLDQPIRDALNAIKINQVTSWIQLPAQSDGTHPWEKIYFVGATNREAIKLDDNLREAIRRQMMMEKGSIRNNVAKEVAEMLAKANVQITDATFDKAWRDLRTKATGGAKQSG